NVRSPLMAASATFALKAGVWFRRGRLVMVSPDSLGTACPLSGRNSTYRPVQISGASSLCLGVLERSEIWRSLLESPFGYARANFPPQERALETASTPPQVA